MEKENKPRGNVLTRGSKNLNIENWFFYHPDGSFMFTHGEKKAEWYLSRKYAVLIGEYKVQLNFVPKGYGFSADEIFGRTARETKCVVSGLEDELQRHHIVPYCYRSFFPKEFKSKNHHDVVLMNQVHHSNYEKEATKFKDKIAEMYGEKTIAEYNGDYTEKLRNINFDYVIAYSNIRSILSSYKKISNDDIIKKLHIISERTKIPYELVSGFNFIQLYKLKRHLYDVRCKNLNDFKKNHRKYYDHGYHIVQLLNTGEKIENFVKLWRNHFIEIMKPKHMPVGWSIDFRVKTNMNGNKK